MNKNSPQYASFGQRFIALIIDNIVFYFLLGFIFMMIFDTKEYTHAELDTILKTQGLAGLINVQQMLIKHAILLSIIVFFWVRYGATPGKMLLKLKVVDTTTGAKLTILQALSRYLGYFLSFPLGIGFLWMLKDEKNQCWHDKLSNSVVIRQGTVLSTAQPETEKSPRKDDNDTFAA